MRTTIARPALLALAAMMVMAGCAQNPRYATSEFKTTQVSVQVSNHNWMDVVVYAVSSGSRSRLGTVTTGMDQRFRIPTSITPLSGAFHLEADPVGSNEVFSSGQIMLQPGSRIVWSIENQMGLSSYRVDTLK